MTNKKGKKTKSMRGKEVDFDLLKIKTKLQKTEKPMDVKTREDFVHTKRKRRGKSKVTNLIGKTLKKGENESKEKGEEESPRVENEKEIPSANIIENEEGDDNKSDNTTNDILNYESETKSKKKKKRKIVKKDEQ